MANSSANDHNYKFVNHIVFMFQIVNDSKSAPFAPPSYIKLPCTPPKIIKSPYFCKFGKICQPFFILNIGKWNVQNLQQIAQNSPNSPTLCKNHAKFTQSMPISQGSLPPVVKLSKFMTFTHFHNFSEIRTIRLVGN